MEFKFDINRLFKNEITKLDGHSLATFASGKIGSEFRNSKNDLSFAIDAMGQASAKAQGLHVVITDTSRMLQSEDHHLYIMKEKDEHANNRLGCIVGLLKVGHKKLFVHNSHGIHHEVSPLCVLDFYIHESRQRKGSGKKLFEYMLQTENTKAEALAIDRPSKKFLSFLMKHYHLKSPIPQVNNFVVFEAFFHTEAAAQVKSHRHTLRDYRRVLSGDHRKRSAFVADISNNTSCENFLMDILPKRSESRESSYSSKHDAQFTERNDFTGLDMKTSNDVAISQNRYSRHMTSASPLISEPTQLHIPTDFTTETTPPIMRKRSGHNSCAQLVNNTTTTMDHHNKQQTGINDSIRSKNGTDVNWNPFGVTPQIGRFSAASRKYQNTRLW